MNKSPDSHKKKKKTTTGRQTAKILKQEGAGIGGVQTGTQSDEKPAKGKQTSREVRDLG